MKFRSHIPKPLLFSKLKLLAVGLFTVLSCILVNPITAHADMVSEIVEAIVAQYNGTSDSNRGGSSAIVNGVAYTRTGYLCYLLTKDGANTGLPAYAFYSPGFNGIAGSKWVCTSRRGHSVSGWTAEAPWGVTAWGNGGSPSYEPQIRDWMLQPIDGKPQAQQFVFKTWGVEAEKNFQSDKYILVIETIMNFQYSVKGGSGGAGASASIDPAIRQGVIAESIKAAKTIVAGMPDSVLNNILHDEYYNRKGIYSKANYIKYLANDIQERVFARLSQESSDGGGRTFVGPPLIGTVPNLITYKNGNTVFDSYTNKVAPHAEKIKVSEAGFTAYTGTGSLTDSEVQSYGVAMLIIHCKNDSIHTYPIS